MYRVGGIAVYDEHLLVEHNVRHDFCFVPGGRVDYGENAIEPLATEIREELGEEVKIGRLVLVADNLFELDNDQFQEVALYFLIEFAPGSKILDRVFTMREPYPSGYLWIRWNKQASSRPLSESVCGRFLRLPNASSTLSLSVPR